MVNCVAHYQWAIDMYAWDVNKWDRRQSILERLAKGYTLEKENMQLI